MSVRRPTTGQTLVKQYKGLLWWTMGKLGVTESIMRKVLVAVGIQFAVSLLQVALPYMLSDIYRLEASILLFGLALVAFINTVLIVRDDFVVPITDLSASAEQIADGELDTAPAATTQPDEVGQLTQSFARMYASIETTASQADALANQRFDSPVLNEDLPGKFGEALDRMASNLHEYIEEVERERNRMQLLNYLVSHDIPNILNVIKGHADLLESQCDEEATQHIDVIEEQTTEIETITNMVGQLSSDKALYRMDVIPVLDEALDRTKRAYPTASVSLDLPDGDESATVYASPLLRRAFQNLIENGIEHNDSNDPEVNVSVTTDPDKVTVRVSDNGPGLEGSDAQALFSDATPGTGLHIIYTVITRFDGEITVAETSEAGTDIVVTLPLIDEGLVRRR